MVEVIKSGNLALRFLLELAGLAALVIPASFLEANINVGKHPYWECFFFWLLRIYIYFFRWHKKCLAMFRNVKTKRSTVPFCK